MSWQDELAQLDSALASGQISADEYRTRRDRVIAQASGQSAPEQPQPQQGAEPTAVFRPVQPQQQPGDRTQVVSGQGHGTGNEHTHVVGRSDADSTQIVHNVPQHQPQFPPPPPPPPWESQQPHPQAMTPPPWANEDLPPEFGQQSWPRQGPEVFEEKSGGGTGKVVGVIVAAVLVLAIAGGAIWFFGFKDDGGDNNNQAGGETSQQQEPSTTSSKPPPPDIPEGPFLDLPGEKVFNRTVPIAQAVAEQVPTDAEAKLLQSVGVSEISGLVTEENDLRSGIWAFKVGEGGDPAAVLQAMDELYQQAKYELISEENGVKVRKLAAEAPEDPTVFRAHYVTDDGYLVRVEVYGADSANVESTFNDLIADETDEFAPVS